MNIIPAIDLLGGKAVRLQKGEYEKVTVYSDSPAKVAKYFENEGAKFLHIVDLDGAKDGTTANFDTIKEIVSESNLIVEVGGGIRARSLFEVLDYFYYEMMLCSVSLSKRWIRLASTARSTT